MRIPVANPQPGKLTRPRLYRVKSKLYRGRKSTLAPRTRLANPKRKRRRLSLLARRAAIRNLRKARSKRRAALKTISHRRTRNPFESTLMTLNPQKTKRRRHTMARRHKRTHHRRRFHNPALSAVSGLLSGPKEMMSSGFVMEAAGVAAGFVLPGVVMNYIPATWRSAKWQYYATKVATVAALSAAANMVNKRVSRFVLVGGGVSLLLDLYTEFLGGGSPTPTPTAAAPAPAATGTQAYMGIPNSPGAGIGAYTGVPGWPGASLAGMDYDGLP